MLKLNFAALNLSYVNLECLYEYKANKINQNYKIAVDTCFQ